MNQGNDLKKIEAQLLDDIEAFARSTANPSSPAVPSPVKGEATPSTLRTPSLESPSPQNPSKPPSSINTPATEGGLLGRLKQEVLAKQMTESQRFSLKTQRSQFISEALEQAFQYLADLCTQLNALTPPSPYAYAVSTAVILDQMAWVEGRTDFRREQSASENRLMETVTLRYRLARNHTFQIEKESPANETFRAVLYDRGITFKETDIRNVRGQIERTHFSFPCEVKAGLIFVADFQKGDIRFQRRNIARYGAQETRLPLELINKELLEELAKQILGEANQLDRMLPPPVFR